MSIYTVGSKRTQLNLGAASYFIERLPITERTSEEILVAVIRCMNPSAKKVTAEKICFTVYESIGPYSNSSEMCYLLNDVMAFCLRYVLKWKYQHIAEYVGIVNEHGKNVNKPARRKASLAVRKVVERINDDSDFSQKILSIIDNVNSEYYTPFCCEGD